MSDDPTLSETRLRDADRSQAAILLAAREEFAGHGLAGARMDRIAERADVNKRLIYYYFGSKDDLFLAVLERVYADIRTAEQQLHLDEVEPVEAVRRL
uniref:TetR/AcrR family transcriptional regulator n=2 Tax=Pseudomonadota TaxID=1224 RepID=UPI000A62305E